MDAQPRAQNDRVYLHGMRQPRSRIGSTLDDVEDVAVGIFEPTDLHTVTAVEITFERQPRHVVTLEDDAFGSQLSGHVVDGIADLPRHGRGLVRAGVFRSI